VTKTHFAVEALRKMDDLIWCSSAEASCRESSDLSLERIIEVIVFTLLILAPDVMRFRHDLLVIIGIFYHAIKFQTLIRSRVVKWLRVVQQPILEVNENTVNDYILIILKHDSTNFVSPVLINVSLK
jgi:hypothetical protein